MSTPSQGSNAQPSGAATNAAALGSAGPSTPAGAGSLAPSTAAAIAQHNASTPRSNPPTVHPSPASHRSPAAVRSLATTPMARAGSLQANGSAVPGSTPMQRGHTTGMKGVGTPGGRGGSFLGGKSVPGASSAAVGLGIGAAGAAASGSLSSPAANQASPAIGFTPGTGGSHALPGFDSPAVSGAAGAVDMGISLSSLGMNMTTGMSATGSTAARMDEEERRRRLEAVLDTLRKRPGRISREAVERLGRRCEMDMQMDGEDELSLAGKNAVMLEVHFKPNKSPLVERVSVAFPTAPDAMAAHADKASKILQQDLTPSPGIAAINASLDKFSDNLERLARLDKLSIPGANCFEAVFGVYTSLKKLYDHERKVAETLMSGGNSEHELDLEIMCQKSGRPRMHARGRVGLSLEYWKHRRLLKRSTDKAQEDPDAMDVDGDTKKQDATSAEEEQDIHSITIECEPCPPALYQPIRNTENWLSERTEKPLEETDATAESETAPKGEEERSIVEWVEPDPPIIPTAEPDPMSANATANPSQPHARFVAKFEPPVILPLQVAAQVYASVNVNIMQESIAPSTMDGLILPQSHGQGQQPAATSSEPRQINHRRTVTVPDLDGAETHHEWDLNLFLSRAEPAVRIEQLPFAHPRQVVALLPTLRQYALVTRLLQNTFSSSGDGTLHNNGAHSQRETLLGENPTELDLMSFLSEPASTPRTLDVAFSTVPSPRLTVSMPGADGPKHCAFAILQNGEIELDGQDIVPEKDENGDGGGEGQKDVDPAEAEVNEEENNVGGKSEKTKAGILKALSVAEDLGIWAEWARARFLTET